GEAYPSSIEGGDDMTEEELFERGINATAGVHVDFMVGTADLSITGKTRDGKEVVIFENGNFVF
ncbi:MAG: aminopeptidase, partial [Oscillospiraceae bacterium]|nr:aminopeptidase [Oscillospiraceae bacterium]